MINDIVWVFSHLKRSPARATSDVNNANTILELGFYWGHVNSGYIFHLFPCNIALEHVITFIRRELYGEKKKR